MEGISQEDGILSVDLNKEILSSAKNPWRFAKIAKELRENGNSKKVTLESVSKIASNYDFKIYELKEKLCKQF